MEILDLFLQTSSSVSLLGTIMTLLLVYLVSTFSFSSQEDKKEPPGPRPLPLLENECKQNNICNIYCLFTVYLGPKKVVVLAGYKTVKEALVNYAEEFGERDPMLIMLEVSQGHGVLWSNGESWKKMRRFAFMNLRDYGMGKKACEDKICEEKAFDTTQPVNYVCKFTSLVDRTNRNSQLVGSPSIQVYNLFPWTGRWISNKKKFCKLYEANKKINLELFRRLKETLNPQMCRGFVDAFLVRKQHLEVGNHLHFHNENLLMTVIQLFGAGTETTSTTIRWGLLFMAKYPKIQDQVQEELSRVIGSRQVQVEDRKNLPFTDAVIHETQRLANIIPFSLPHKTSQDVTFQGYFIKKGTTVYPLLTSVLYDESEWEKPYSFYPAHFLDKDGKFVKRDAFLPFSAGRRICLGESLARMELFIFFTTLLQHFRFTPPPGVSEDELDLTAHMGLSLSPSPHKLCAVPCM
uniref:Cytochrome P450 2K1-like n=1 Tax=Seriola dumerili TaxID=41447 RepID=A0A3B4UJ36_SERDU